MDLLAHGPGADRHRPSETGEPVDPGGVGPGHVDHDRRAYDAPVSECHPGDPLVVTLDADDLGAEAEPGTERLGGVLQVAGGELRVVDVARVGHPDGAGERLGRLGPERLVLHPGRRTHHACVEQGQPLLDLARHPSARRGCRAASNNGTTLVACPPFQQRHPAGHQLGKVRAARPAEVGGPVAPVVPGLPSHRHPGQRRVAEPDDRAGVARRSVARARQRIEVQGSATATGELVGQRGADHPRADDDDVGVPTRPCVLSCGRHGTSNQADSHYVGIIGYLPTKR